MGYIEQIVASHKRGKPTGIYSACSANVYVLKAVMKRALETNTVALIEATANQVNQNGGYTGMTPAMFRDFVGEIAASVGLDDSRVILGGDHLGPLTWVALPEAEAMRYAEVLIYSYVEAGFTKIHIDTSMRLGSDDAKAPLDIHVIARRGAQLCRIAEDAYAALKRKDSKAPAPLYVIGSEVPIPGGAQESEANIHVTLPEDCLATLEAFRDAFAANDLHEAWARVIGLVVQPGVEFGNDHVFEYDRTAAAELVAVLKDLPIVFEGHSTDYQTRVALREMVEDGIAILKVGPALTFTMREGLFALEMIERELLDGSGIWLSNFARTLDRKMLEKPGQWEKHYHGNGVETCLMRKFSYSDRSRYYMSIPEIQASVERLLNNLRSVNIPLSVVSQYMPIQYKKCRAGALPAQAESLLLDKIGDLIDDYLYAMDPLLFA